MCLVPCKILIDALHQSGLLGGFARRVTIPAAGRLPPLVVCAGVRIRPRRAMSMPAPTSKIRADKPDAWLSPPMPPLLPLLRNQCSSRAVATNRHAGGKMCRTSDGHVASVKTPLRVLHSADE